MRKLLVALGGLFLCLAANAQNVAIGSLTAQGADCTTAGACITLQFESNDVASASIQLSGSFTATVQFEASSDKGTTWVAIAGTPLNSTTAVTSATTANTWKFNVASITNIRARASAWTSAPTVVIRSSRAVANAIGGGGTSLPALSDNGTNIISTEPFAAPNGTCLLPSQTFANDLNTGLLDASANDTLDVCTGGAQKWRWGTGANFSYQVLEGDTDNSRDLGVTGSARWRSIFAATSIQLESAANGALWTQGQATELLTLSTVGTTTDTTANLLPANAIILGVVARVTTTITVATSWQLGDATTAGRFTAANSTMTVGTTDIGKVHLTTGIASATTGMFQTAASKVRVTTVGTPGAGVIRITVFYMQFTPPTS